MLLIWYITMKEDHVGLRPPPGAPIIDEAGLAGK